LAVEIGSQAQQKSWNAGYDRSLFSDRKNQSGMMLFQQLQPLLANGMLKSPTSANKQGTSPEKMQQSSSEKVSAVPQALPLGEPSTVLQRSHNNQGASFKSQSSKASTSKTLVAPPKATEHGCSLDAPAKSGTGTFSPGFPESCTAPSSIAAPMTAACLGRHPSRGEFRGETIRRDPTPTTPQCSPGAARVRPIERLGLEPSGHSPGRFRIASPQPQVRLGVASPNSPGRLVPLITASARSPSRGESIRRESSPHHVMYSPTPTQRTTSPKRTTTPQAHIQFRGRASLPASDSRPVRLTPPHSLHMDGYPSSGMSTKRS